MYKIKKMLLISISMNDFSFWYFDKLLHWILYYIILYEIQDVKNNQTYFNTKLRKIKKLINYFFSNHHSENITIYVVFVYKSENF